MSDAEIIQYTADDGQCVTLDAVTVRDVFATSPTVTDREVAVFMGLCAARGLNPFAKDAYLVKYGDNPASTIVSKDYFMRAAASDPDFDGFEAGVIVINGAGALEYRDGAMCFRQGETLCGGWARVHRKGWAHPVTATVSIEEYSTGKLLWASKPATMVRKVALVQALREAFPARFGGLYDRAEMGAAAQAVPAEVESITEG